MRSPISITKSFVAFGLALLGIESARANLFINGSFEDENYSGSPYGNVWNVGTGPNGWTQGINQGVSIYNVGYANNAAFTLPTFGSQFYYVGQAGANASLSQSISLTAGQNCQLSFYIAPLTSNQPAFLDLTVSSAGETFLPGLTYNYTEGATTNAAPPWSLQTFSFTANFSQSYTFTFTTQGAGDAVTLDNVSLTAIPEPASTAALLGLIGAGAVAVLRRRVARA